ncbi:MAG: lipocalin family protein [Rubrivivax sp.]
MGRRQLARRGIHQRTGPRTHGAPTGAPTNAPTRAPRPFAPDEVRFEPGRRWRSAATNAVYPVQWQVLTPAGAHTVRALLDAQELDGCAGTGAVYWEGLAELLDASGRRVGLGYLEMTGYAAPLKVA